MKTTRTAWLPCAAMLFVLAGFGCGKLKHSLTKGDGGESASATKGPGPLAFLSGFEGEIDIEAKGKIHSSAHAAPQAAAAPSVTNVSLFVKDKKFRVDIPAEMAKEPQIGKGYAVLNMDEKKLYVVLETKREVIVIDLNRTGEHLKGLSARAPGGSGAPSGPSKPPPKVTKTGHIDKVAGYSCEVWEIVDEESKATMCIAEEGFSWLHVPLTGAPAELAWISELMDGKHFPLRFVGYEKDKTTESARVEVTKIDKKTLPASEFEVPAGFRVLNLDDLLKGPPPGVVPAHH
jgi:hypothetical protein